MTKKFRFAYKTDDFFNAMEQDEKFRAIIEEHETDGCSETDETEENEMWLVELDENKENDKYLIEKMESIGCVSERFQVSR
jgi:hypothetical protein